VILSSARVALRKIDRHHATVPVAESIARNPVEALQRALNERQPPAVAEAQQPAPDTRAHSPNPCNPDLHSLSLKSKKHWPRNHTEGEATDQCRMQPSLTQSLEQFKTCGTHIKLLDLSVCFRVIPWLIRP
jgi:hypothetical protein